MQANKKKMLIYGGVAIALLVLVVIIANTIKAAKDAKKEQDEREQTLADSEQISVQIAQGNPANNFNPKPYTDRLNSDFNAMTADTSLYAELILLDDNQIRAIWKDWEDRYKKEPTNNQKGKTLGLALYDAYWFTRSYTFGWDWTYHAKKFYDKLKAIGLP